MFLSVKLKGGALYVSVIISILISIVLSLFIVLAYYNTRSVQIQNSDNQLHCTLESGFEIAKSSYYQFEKLGYWQKMPYNNDSVSIKKMPWGCFTLIDVKSKNKHASLQKTGLFGCAGTPDTALLVVDLNRPIGLAGSIKFNGNCYLPKAGVKSAYIEGTSFSDMNSLRPYIKQAPSYLPELDENYLKSINDIQTNLNPYQDSLFNFIPETLNHSFAHKTATIKQGSIFLNNQILSNNIKIIASDVITVDASSQLDQVLLIARKVIFKKGFKGSVHVIAKDSIVTENDCEFNYPSSFCVYNSNQVRQENQVLRGIFFGENCKFKGALLAANDKEQNSKLIIKLNKQFELIGNLYSANYSDAQGDIYGTIMCQSLLLQTSSAVYENHLFNVNIDSRKYGKFMTVPLWLKTKNKVYTCAKWF